MPEPIHPPNNIVTPRQLDRWLDVNAQNGALTRTRGFVSVPTNNITADRIQTSTSGVLVTNNGTAFQTFYLLNKNGIILEQSNLDIGEGHTFLTIGANYQVTTSTGHSTALPYIGWTGTINFTDTTWTLTTVLYPSDKVLQFNFQCQQNFSLVNDSYLKAFVAAYQGKVSVCIANILSGTPNTVVRYRLTQPEIESVYATQYRGQAILGRYFQIEFWGIANNSVIIQPTASSFILNTSILSKTLDYRYGVDFQVHSTTATKIEAPDEFKNNNALGIDNYNIPLTFNANTINGVN